MPLAIGRTADVCEHAGHVPVGVGIVGLLPEHAFERRERQFVVAEFREHAAEARAGLEVVVVQFDRGVVALPRRRQVARAIEEFGEHEHNLRRRPLRLQHGAERLGRLGEFARGLEIGGEVEEFGCAGGLVVVHLDGDLRSGVEPRQQGRQRLGVVRVQTVCIEAELQLAACANESAAAPDAQPSAVRDDPFAHPCSCGRTARCESRQLVVDLPQRESCREQPHELPAHHELLKIKPLERTRAAGGLEEAAANPVPHGCGGRAEHSGHHRHRVEPPHTRNIVGVVGVKKVGCGVHRPDRLSLRALSNRIASYESLRCGAVVRDLGGHDRCPWVMWRQNLPDRCAGGQRSTRPRGGSLPGGGREPCFAGAGEKWKSGLGS